MGVDARTGKAWKKKIKRWFGDGRHLIADTQFEIPEGGMHLTPASHAEQCAQRDLAFQGFEADRKTLCNVGARVTLKIFFRRDLDSLMKDR